MSQFFFPVTQNTSKKEPVMKDPTTSASSFWPRAAILYFFVLFPLSFLLPGPFAWENGPIEMGQNMILLTGIIWSIYHYTQETHLHRPSYWLFAASFFLLLFGREISWGRVFLLKEMTETGPVFWSMKDLPYHRVIDGAIGLLSAAVIHLFYQSVNVQKTLHCLKKNRLMFLLTMTKEKLLSTRVASPSLRVVMCQRLLHWRMVNLQCIS